MLNRTVASFSVLCAFMVFGNTASAFADAGEIAECNPQPKCKLERVCPPKPCCEPVCCPSVEDDCCKRNVCPPTGTITPGVDLVKGEGMDWFITADYTYWTARENSTEVAISNVIQGSTASKEGSIGKVFRLDNKWVSGFKVGLGTDFCHDGWDVYAEYTWFNTTNSKRTPGEFPTPPLMVAPLLDIPLLFDGYWDVNNAVGSANGAISYSSANAKWHMHMNVVDVELGRNFYVSPRLMLRPFYGLKGAWNQQHMNIAFHNLSLAMTNSMINQLKNWGIGIRAGMDTSWHFCRDLSLFGNMAFTGLWEEFKARRFDSSAIGGTIINSTVNVKEKQCVVAPVIEWMLGFKWETGLSCDTYHLAIAAAWEEQVWFGQNKFIRHQYVIPNNGDTLTLQGLTVDIRFDF